MTGAEGAKLTTIPIAAALGPALALSTDEILWLVAMPMIAAWGGLIGIGIFEGQPVRRIALNVAASVCLAGVVAIVAAYLIDRLNVRGFPAMLISLTIGMGAISVARKLRGFGGTAADRALEIFGLQRRDIEPTDQMEDLLKRLDEKERDDAADR